MTKEDQNLLKIDLCARLPYNVKVCYNNKAYIIDAFTGNRFIISETLNAASIITYPADIKPYLLPLSSMNEEQQKEYNTFSLGPDWVSNPYYNVPAFEVLDWLNAYHFDYRGLINKGLAIDATNLNIYGKRI